MTDHTNIEQSLEGYKQDFKELINIKPKQFDIAAVAHMITSTPPRKWAAAQAVVDATIAKKEIDRRVKVLRGQLMFTAKNNEKLKAAPDRQGWVDSRPEVETLEIEAINADAQLLANKLAFECLDDLFTAGKKIMDYLVEQEKSTKQYNRFVDEGKRSR